MGDDGASDADRLARLRRTAFGRPSSAEEEAAASAALRELSELEERRKRAAFARGSSESVAARTERPQAEQSASVVTDSPEHDDLPSGTEVARSAAIRRRWVIAGIIAGLIVVGIAAGFAVGMATAAAGLRPGGAPAAAPSTAVRDSSGDSFGPGDIAAADSWFTSPIETQDAVPPSVWSTSLDKTRRVWHPFDTAGWSLWIAEQSTTREFCLVAALDDSSIAQLRCVTAAVFEKDGVSLRFGDDVARWNGTELTTSKAD
jgi:hypothetical protein